MQPVVNSRLVIINTTNTDWQIILHSTKQHSFQAVINSFELCWQYDNLPLIRLPMLTQHVTFTYYIPHLEDVLVEFDDSTNFCFNCESFIFAQIQWFLQLSYQSHLQSVFELGFEKDRAQMALLCVYEIFQGTSLKSVNLGIQLISMKWSLWQCQNYSDLKHSMWSTVIQKCPTQT